MTRHPSEILKAAAAICDRGGKKVFHVQHMGVFAACFLEMEKALMASGVMYCAAALPNNTSGWPNIGNYQWALKPFDLNSPKHIRTI